VPRRRKSLTLGRMPADHSGATVPDFHRLPPATRQLTIRAFAAVSIERFDIMVAAARRSLL
jgi:hypothetical protein